MKGIDESGLHRRANRLPHPSWPDAAAIAKAERTIATRAAAVNAERLFVAGLAELSISLDGPATEASHGTVPALAERLAFDLYPFFGRHQDREIRPSDITEVIGAVKTLFDARWLRTGMAGDALAKLLTQVRRRVETVRGDSFPEQISERIQAVQGRFEGWFAARAGLGPVRAQEVLCSLHRAQLQRYHSLIAAVRCHVDDRRAHWEAARKTRNRDRSHGQRQLLGSLRTPADALRFYYLEALGSFAVDHLPVERADLDLEPPLSKPEWQTLLERIGLTTQHRGGMAEPVAVRSRPLFALSDDRVVLICLPHALDVLWEVYEALAREDPTFYEEYQRYKASWLESRIAASLATVFPRHQIYRGLTYPDPDRPGGTAEVDLAVAHGPFLVLIEAKASRFRLESQLGDAGRLRTDLRRNVEDAFAQARRAARYIAGAAAPELVEQHGGRRLTIDRSRIQRVYLLTVSLRYLGGLATGLARTRDLGLFVDDEFPFALNLDDLSTILEFCEGPDVLLHFIERALAILTGPVELVVDELDLFGAYLQTRLQERELWRDRRIDFAWITGWSEVFDEWSAYRLGYVGSPPERPTLDVPSPIREVLAELRSGQEDSARWIAFSLLGLPRAALDELAARFQEIRRASLAPGYVRHLQSHGDGLALSIVGAVDPPIGPFAAKVYERAAMEKYRTKAARSIAFGVAIDRPDRAFETCVLLDHPWQRDEAMEETLRTQAPLQPRPGGAPGRNDPCFCGSGRKVQGLLSGKAPGNSSTRRRLKLSAVRRSRSIAGFPLRILPSIAGP
jgi:hypothetical protein